MTTIILATDTDSNMGTAAVLAVMLLLLCFIPTIFAAVRHVPHVGSVVVINLFLAGQSSGGLWRWLN